MNNDDVLFIARIINLLLSESEYKTAKTNLSSCYGKCVSETENPVEVCIYHGSMIVTFNDVDRDQIQEFIHVLDVNSCTYTQEENEFEIRANGTNLYMILLYLTMSTRKLLCIKGECYGKNL